MIHNGKEVSRNDFGNHRPITLTRKDYKKITKALALRLLSVINTIVSEDQIGVINGRNIAFQLRLFDDLGRKTTTKNKPGALVAPDFSKAFKTLSKKCVVKALDILTLQAWWTLLWRELKAESKMRMVDGRPAGFPLREEHDKMSAKPSSVCHAVEIFTFTFTYPLNTDVFTTNFVHFSLFSITPWDLANCSPVHPLMLSSHLFFLSALPSFFFHCDFQDGFVQT